MADEARSMWEVFIAAPENAHLLKRYAKSAKEPAPLFDSIGEDLASSNQEVREQAYWALVIAMPELTSILHERETRHPGWRDVERKDQHMINRGADILSYLHRRFVVERYFKIRGENGKDPRPLMNKIIRNRQKDAQKKSEREAQPDYEYVLEIPDSSPSVEESVVEKIAYEECCREIRALPFPRSADEFNLFETVYVDCAPIAEVAKSMGISEGNLRQIFSRCRKKFVAERDALLTYLLITESQFGNTGKIPRFPKNPKGSEWWAERAKRAIRPGMWANGQAPDGHQGLVFRPITRGFRDAPGQMHLFANLNIFPSPINADDVSSGYRRLGHYIPVRYGYSFKMHFALYASSFHTEIPSLNEALAEVPSNYWVCLHSNVLPNAFYYS